MTLTMVTPLKMVSRQPDEYASYVRAVTEQLEARHCMYVRPTERWERAVGSLLDMGSDVDEAVEILWVSAMQGYCVGSA